jgi:hypothetical protein
MHGICRTVEMPIEDGDIYSQSPAGRRTGRRRKTRLHRKGPKKRKLCLKVRSAIASLYLSGYTSKKWLNGIHQQRQGTKGKVVQFLCGAQKIAR